MPQGKRFERTIEALTVLACVALLVIDKYIPLEAAVGVLYVPIVVLSLMSRRARFVVFTACLATVFTGLDYFISADGGSKVWAVFDRVAAMVAIWFSVALGLRRLWAEDSLLRSLKIERLLRRELDHRVRNNLAFISAMVDLTSEPASTTKERFARTMKEKVRGIAAVHDLLSRRRWAPVELRDLLGALAPRSDAPFFTAEGPEVLVPAEYVMPLGMVVHELILNSAKHGALGSPDGRVEVRWTVQPAGAGAGRRLEFCWQESDGPSITSYPKRGRGTELIEEFIRDVLGGEIDMAYPQGGVFHRFSLDLDRPPTEPVVAAPALAAASA